MHLKSNACKRIAQKLEIDEILVDNSNQLDSKDGPYNSAILKVIVFRCIYGKTKVISKLSTLEKKGN